MKSNGMEPFRANQLSNAGRSRHSGSLEVYLLGIVDFDSSLVLQERLCDEIAEREDRQGALLICEHPPIVTIGRQGSRSDVLAEPRELVSREMDVRWLNRGGGCLVHCPGQLAVYPIVPVQRLDFGLVDYRRALEQSVIDACRDLHIPAVRRDEEPGIWCRLGQFGFFGVAVKSRVAYHGMFINVAPDMEYQRLVRSSGLADRATSLAALRVRPTAMHSVRSAIVPRLSARLGYDRFHIYTGHPLLRRTTRKVYVHT